MKPSKTVIVGWDMVSPLGTELADQWHRAAAGESGELLKSVADITIWADVPEE